MFNVCSEIFSCRGLEYFAARADLYQMGQAYGTTSGSPGYNADADQDKDGDVDGNDLTIISTNYGAT